MSQIIHITGNIGKDAETRDTRSGSVTGFNVAVRQGYGENEETIWYRCSLWGQRGDKLRQYLTKGAKVYVSGELVHDEYEGKPQFNVNVSGIDPFMGNRNESPASGGGYGSGAGQGSSRATDIGGDMDDDVPFASNDPAWEGRVG
ncbi:single-stranded DNA-binding protein [Sphingomicrobium sp. XHP0235]|uniref:single-stranded DNA-binding protein n=1 Tax=Sphingomicrobium aquimarinum TaxID=3133971 RepID=UPI0031FEE129